LKPGRSITHKHLNNFVISNRFPSPYHQRVSYQLTNRRSRSWA